MKFRIVSLALIAGFSGHAAAGEWTPSAELGVVNTTGNTDTTSLNGRFRVAGGDERWTHDYSLSGLHAQNGGETSADRYEFGAKAARNLGERSYLGGAGRYEHDDFAAYSEQATLALNYGWRAIASDDQDLLLEAGPGGRRAKLAAGGHEQSGLLRGFADYKLQFTDTASFFNTLLVEATPDNTFAQNDIGISVAINASLALKAALQARHNTDVPSGVERTDTLTSVNVVWAPKKKH